MAILPITIYGDQVLRKKAKPVKQVNDKTIQLIRDMFDTMRNAGGVGLAANQVASENSLFVIDLKPVEGYENSKPIVMINPEIILMSDEEVIYEEGCLSLPTLRADVARPEIIKIKYLDTDEKEKMLEADDFFARVILHEYDHLLGKMIPDRLDEEIKNAFKENLTLIKERKVEIDYPVTKK